MFLSDIPDAGVTRFIPLDQPILPADHVPTPLPDMDTLGADDACPDCGNDPCDCDDQ